MLYGSRGHSGVPKERIEVAWDGCSVVIDDFRNMEAHGTGRSRSLRTQDKGVPAHLTNFLGAIRGTGDVRAPVIAGLDAAERIDEIRALLRGPGSAIPRTTRLALRPWASRKLRLSL